MRADVDQPERLNDLQEVVLTSGRVIFNNGSDQLVVTIDDFADVGLEGLVHLWREKNGLSAPAGGGRLILNEDYQGEDRCELEELLISEVPREDFDRVWSSVSNIALILTSDGRLAAEVWAEVSKSARAADILGSVTEHMSAFDGKVLRIDISSNLQGTSCRTWFEFPVEGRSVGDAFVLGRLIATAMVKR
jgi:hypothetical protein